MNPHRGRWGRDEAAHNDLDAAVKTARDMVSPLRLDVEARRHKVQLQVAGAPQTNMPMFATSQVISGGVAQPEEDIH